MVFLPRFDLDLVLEHLPRATVFMAADMYTRLLADPRLDERACRHVRLFVSGSAPLAASTTGSSQPAPGTRSWNATG